jgi:hypothetical protein
MLDAIKRGLAAFGHKLREEPVVLSQLAALVVSGFAVWGSPLTAEQGSWVAGAAVLLAALVGRSQVKPMVKIGASEDQDGDMVAGPAAPGIPDDVPVDVVEAGEANPAEEFRVED